MKDRAIHNFMKQCKAYNYTVRNGKVDVEGSISIPKDCHTIPIPFRSVSCSFVIQSPHTTSLHNSPIEVGGSYYCSATKITSLEYAPREVQLSFSCSDTNITSLKGCPQYVGGSFVCSATDVTSLKGCPEYVGGTFYAVETKLANLEDGPIEIGGRLLCTYTFKEEPRTDCINAKEGVVWRRNH